MIMANLKGSVNNKTTKGPLIRTALQPEHAAPQQQGVAAVTSRWLVGAVCDDWQGKSSLPGSHCDSTRNLLRKAPSALWLGTSLSHDSSGKDPLNLGVVDYTSPAVSLEIGDLLD